MYILQLNSTNPIKERNTCHQLMCNNAIGSRCMADTIIWWPLYRRPFCFHVIPHIHDMIHLTWHTVDPLQYYDPTILSIPHAAPSLETHIVVSFRTLIIFHFHSLLESWGCEYIIHTYIHTYKLTCIHTYIHTYTHIHTYIHTRIHTYTI